MMVWLQEAIRKSTLQERVFKFQRLFEGSFSNYKSIFDRDILGSVIQTVRYFK